MATPSSSQPTIPQYSSMASQVTDAMRPSVGALASPIVGPSMSPGAGREADALAGGASARDGSSGGGMNNLIASAKARTDGSGAGGSMAQQEEFGGLQLSAALERLPVGLTVSVPVGSFRIRNLLTMTPGELIETQWGQGEDLPLASGDVQLAWSEFEVVETKLAVRVTRLA